MKKAIVIRLAAAAWLLLPMNALACSVCFGRSDSALAKGMNMGIFTLLAVIVMVLAAISSFFVYMARRSAKAASASEAISQPSNPAL